jgi:hypothetical protein
MPFVHLGLGMKLDRPSPAIVIPGSVALESASGF